MYSNPKKPSLVMIDGSFAIWNAALQSFCRETRNEYYHRCYRVANGQPQSEDLKKTMVHNCLSHAMRAAKIMVCKHYKRGRNFVQTAMHWVALLFSSETVEMLDDIVDGIFTVLCSKMHSGKVTHAFNKLAKYEYTGKLARDFTEATGVGEYRDDVDYLIGSKRVEKNHERKSPFCERYISKFEQLLKSDCSTDDDPPNLYYSVQFCKPLHRIILSRICCTSKIMLGDLSRHITAQTSENEKHYFNDYRKVYAKMIVPEKFQNISRNNLTQGVIEQHFKMLKHTFMKEKKRRIDDFVVGYYETVCLIRKQFADTLLHSGLDFAETLKKTSMVKSKFKKRKKTRGKGYYTQSKYIPEMVVAKTSQHDNISSEMPVGVGHLITVEHSTEPTFMWDASREWLKVELFSKQLCKEMPPSKLAKTVLMMTEEQYLYWLDLATINKSLEPTVFSALQKKLQGGTNMGWLSQGAVELYISTTVAKCNKDMHANNFGCVDCGITDGVLSGKLLSLPERANCGRGYRGITIPGDPKMLRNDVFFPCLKRKHFRLLHYSVPSSTLILVDSLPIIGNETETEDYAIMSAFKAFFSAFSNVGEDVVFEKKKYRYSGRCK